jgi:acetyl/propionyl-CoA carboxylase alpha subunit/acetyl-CoA carboxylase carboxyltransferase component
MKKTKFTENKGLQFIMKELKSDARIGIINRGEAAYRFIRAVKEYNLLNGTQLSSVAFYTDKESSAVFAREADYAYPLSGFSRFEKVAGPAYLDYDLLMEALTESGCDGVWVGWGFVSEDAEFVRRVEKAGLVFLGPSSEVMERVGDKIQSKELAEISKTPVTPWSRGPVESLEKAYEMAEHIGYPCVVKASNAGGGRGIRFVFTKEEMAAQYQSAVDETLRITGNTLVFMERLVSRGRHLEVQALADRHGNVKTFGVRDCSVQRKNQKIIEETPPAHLSEATLQAIGQSAVSLLKTAHYEGAGTVEFLYDLDRDEFYFMEVNARLQVEHPITEQLFGVDLVGGQIDVARGKSIEHYNTIGRGHVMEVRLNAEDPEGGFRPAGGDVIYFRPAGGIGVRIDSGITEGSVIPPDFDSMVAKIIVTAPTRKEAIARLERAVAETRVKIDGGTTNRTFLLELLSLKEIKAGGISTRFVEEYLTSKTPPVKEAAKALCAASAEIYRIRENEEEKHFNSEMLLSGRVRTMSAAGTGEVHLQYLGASYTMYLRRLSRTLFTIRLNDKNYYFKYTYGTESSIELNRSRSRVLVTEMGSSFRVEIDNVPYLIESDSGGVVKAPSPGLMLGVKVKPGERVSKGAVLLSLEAMKMELPVIANEEAVVGDILVKAGEQVTAGQSLIRLEKVGGEAAVKHGDDVQNNAFDGTEASEYSFKDEWAALFLGYDALPYKELSRLTNKADSETVISNLIYFNAVEKLFSDEKINAAGYANAMSFSEFLASYYRNFMRNENDFPQPFIEAMKTVFAANGITNIKRRVVDRIIFRLYKSHAMRSLKEKLLSEGLLYLNKDLLGKDLEESLKMRLAPALDELAGNAPALKQTAVEVRYNLFDKKTLHDITRRRLERLERVIDLLGSGQPGDRSYLMNRAVSYGTASEGLLVKNILAGRQADISLEILTRRLYRDCLIKEYKQLTAGTAFLRYAMHSGAVRTTLFVVADTNKEALAEAGRHGEVHTVLIFTHEGVSAAELAALRLPTQRFISAVLGADGMIAYKNYIADAEGRWQVNAGRDFLSPLAYRELRVYRWACFDKTFEAVNENLTFVHAVAKEKPTDERFVVFLNVESTQIEFDVGQNLERLVGVEDALNEAVTVLRSKQAMRKRPLYWNRIIIFVRPQLAVGREQIERYVRMLAERYITNDLGISRVSIIMRADDEHYDELIVYQLSSGGAKTEWRAASFLPLRPMSDYESHVIMARSRNLFYPYELIESFIDGSIGLGKTSFEEYDLAPPADGGKAYVSVKGRAFGQNAANIVFGLITTRDNAAEYKRVIIMSDPTRDMGSLAEGECRRVNAAIDLAEELNIPVEWLPVSSGARIDMKSGTENLDWTAASLKRIIEFTQNGGEINVIVTGTNVGAQSYWNSEATMLMHCRGLLIMSRQASMLLTGKKALDFAGSVSADDNLGIGGAKQIMTPNGEAQIEVENLQEAYRALMHYYRSGYALRGQRPASMPTADSANRDVGKSAYEDDLNQGFATVGDIFSAEKNGERKKPFDIRKVMRAVADSDFEPLERWQTMQDAETAVVWQTRIGGEACGLIGIESRSLTRRGTVPYNGPETYAGGTLYPQSSKKIARGINSFSGKLPLVVLANLSGFDGSPESLRKNQLEWGAEIGRAIVNFKGPILFIVVGRYHGGAYVVFSKQLNPALRTLALEGAYASVIGGAPAAAVVFPGQVAKAAYRDERVIKAQKELEEGRINLIEYNELYKTVHTEKQAEWARNFDQIHSVERAKEVGSIDEIIKIHELRSKIIGYIKN